MFQVPYTSAHKEYRTKLRDFIRKEVIPHINEWEELKTIPKEIWYKMGKLNLLCPQVSPSYGGLGGDFVYSVILAEEMALSNQWGLTANHHSDVATHYLEKHATQKVKDEFLSSCVSGDFVMGMAVTEPDAGSDIFGIKTTAFEKNGEIIINGAKTFISNAMCADLFVIAAKDITPEKQSEFALFLVPSKSPGFSRGKQVDKIGWKSQDTGELFFNDCIIPSSYRIGNAQDGANIFFESIKSERLILSITAISIAEWLIKTTLENKTKELDQNKLFQFVEMITEVKIGLNYVSHLIQLHLLGKSTMDEISMSKCWVTDLANKIAETCYSIYDIYNQEKFLMNSPISRCLRDLRVIKITGGTNETLKDAVAHTLKLNSTDVEDINNIFHNNVSEYNHLIDKAYWKALLQNVDFNIDINSCSKGLSNKCFSNRKIKIKSDIGKIAELSQSDNETVILAIWYILLFKYSQQEAIAIGYLYNGNIIPLIIKNIFTESVPFSSLIKELKNQINKAKKNFTSYSDIVEFIDPRSVYKFPRVLLSFQDDPGISNYDSDIIIRVYDEGKHFVFSVNYNCSYFDKNYIIRLSGHLLNILECLDNDGIERNITSISLLTKNEECKIIESFNQTYLKNDGRLIHHYFEEHATEKPDATALIYGSEQYSYNLINIRANKLAHYLISKGVGPEKKVAILFDRSIEMIISILGIWKAGGAYVPLNPCMPYERLKYILENTKPLLVLTNQSHLMPTIEGLGAYIECFNNLEPTIDTMAVTNPNIKIMSNNLAYVIYTSGSTGVPNGIELEHKGVPNLAASQSRVFKVNSSSRILQFASIIFDASVSEIAMAFYSGASLVIADENQIIPGEPLSELIKECRISHLTLTPSALSVMPFEDYPDLTNLILASESGTQALFEKWGAKRYIYNAYGPSECTVCATILEYQANDVLSIGKPIDNVKIYILDSNMQPVPIGVKGEIYIGGIGVGRGYINNEALNTKKYVPNPFDYGQVIYKTNDIGYWRTDGNVQFIGRRDYQVKIRGYRVELQEIEFVLSTHERVAVAATILREDMGIEKQLVAYIVLTDNLKISLESLRSFCLSKLPEYMVPNYFVFLDEMPKNTSGKIDRSNLPKPNINMSNVIDTDSNEITHKVKRIVMELTGIENISLDYDLKQLGFNSLLLVRLVHKFKEEFSIAIKITELTYDTKIGRLVKIIDKNNS